MTDILASRNHVVLARFAAHHIAASQEAVKQGLGVVLVSHEPRDCEWREAWPGISVWDLFRGGVRAVDRADMDDRAAVYGSSSGGKVYE